MICVGNASTFDTVQELEEFLGEMPTAGYVCDADGLITYFNSEAARVWGRSPARTEHYCGSHKLFYEDGAPMPHDMCWMALALKDRHEYNARPVVIERPDATRVMALAHASPLWDADGSLLGGVNVLLAVTEPKLVRAISRRVAARLSLVSSSVS